MATTLPEPSFIERDPAKVEAENIALYELMTGKTLQPAQPERLYINIISYRESLLRVQIQAAAVKNLVRFSSGQMIDELGLLVGCERLPEQPARTTLRVTLTEILGVDYNVPPGTERGSKDGLYLFATSEPLIIPAGELSGDVIAIATVAGVGGNGYLPGDINTEIEPLANVASVVNLTTSSGGAAVEDDDHYIDRIILAPDSYSTAGPEDAYIYWAKTAHQNIVDVAVLSPAPVQVVVYPLMTTGLPSAEILALVDAALNVRKRRPLTDQVTSAAPVRIAFTIEASLVLYDTVIDPAPVIADIVTALTKHTAALRQKLGPDLLPGKIKAIIDSDNRVYSSDLTSPAALVELEDNEWLDCTAIDITVAGYING